MDSNQASLSIYCSADLASILSDKEVLALSRGVRQPVQQESGPQREKEEECSFYMLAGTYKLVASSQSVTIHPSSVLSGKKPKCIVFGELMRTTRNYARQVTAIDPAWLPELAPSVFISKGAAT